MKVYLQGLVLAVATVCSLAAQPSDDPSSVLLIVNDSTVPEPGTGKFKASEYVANYYAQARKIPKSNVFHMNYRMSCCKYYATQWDSWHMSWKDFDETLRQPLKKFLEEKKLKDKIRYIVPTYGVPSHVDKGTEGLSVDSFLASIWSPFADRLAAGNPYYQVSAASTPPRFRDFQRAYPLYLVTRLDGPTPQIAAALVDKAIEAERGIEKDSGVGYYDFRNVTGVYKAGDDSVRRAYDLCVAAGMRCVFNDQSQTRSMINEAPDTLWAWGWYSGPTTRDVYRFKPGAVGSQLTSYTANGIRSPQPGAYVELFLRRGITATWGTTGEPGLAGYAYGDNLLNHLWNGYNFAESSYIANPYLNWMMVFVGDPLYAPVFKKAQAAQSAGCNPVINVSLRQFGQPGGEGTVNVDAGEGCSWTLQADQSPAAGQPDPWFILHEQSGQGSGQARFTVLPNTGLLPRTASVQTGSRIIQILQSGRDGSDPFVDVPASHPMAEFIRAVKSVGLADPCDGNRFCPDSPITRGDLAQALVRGIYGHEHSDYSLTPFYADVSPQHPRFSFVQRFTELGLAKPCATEPTRFCPGDGVTRSEIAELLIRTRFGSLFTDPTDADFDDVAAESHRYIQKIRDFGFTVGCGWRAYCPDDLVTRSQTAVFLTRAFLTPWEVPFF